MGRRKLTRVLLESGVDRDSKNKQGETALEIAQRKNLDEVVQILKTFPVVQQSSANNSANKHSGKPPSR